MRKVFRDYYKNSILVQVSIILILTLVIFFGVYFPIK
jgi:hypothetical protein